MNFSFFIHAVFSLVGVGAIFLLDGQVFANTIVFTFCMVVNLVIATCYSHQSKRPVSWYVFLLASLLGILMLVPANEKQNRFNERIRDIKDKTTNMEIAVQKLNNEEPTSEE